MIILNYFSFYELSNELVKLFNQQKFCHVLNRFYKNCRVVEKSKIFQINQNVCFKIYL